MAKNKWVDPPEGNTYGFPKEWDGNGTLLEFLLAQGYPQEKIDEYANNFYVKTWSIVNQTE